MGSVEPLASPCTGVCTLDGNRCVGCGRTLDEIAQWTVMGEDERAAVMARVVQLDPPRHGEGECPVKRAPRV